jgi:hypothetical protein
VWPCSQYTARSRRSRASFEPPSGQGGRGGAPPPDCNSPAPPVPSSSSSATTPFLAVGEFVRQGRVENDDVPVRLGLASLAHCQSLLFFLFFPPAACSLVGRPRLFCVSGPG